MDCAAVNLEIQQVPEVELPGSWAQIKNGYEILEALGEGSTGFVHRAKRKQDGTEVALKTIRTVDLEFRDIVQEEYRVLRGISHPHIIQALDLLIASDRVVLVLEFFSGATLRCAVYSAPGNRLPEAAVRGLFRMLLRAIDYLHRHRVVHRDVTAMNVLVSHDLDDLRLVDFNTARRLTDGGALTMTGTQEYASPEVLLGESPSECCDIWSAGLCLHFALAGRLPRRHYRFATLQEFAKIVSTEPVSLCGKRWTKVSESCKAVVYACLELKKAFRPAAMTLLEYEWLKVDDPTPVAAEKGVRRRINSMECAEIAGSRILSPRRTLEPSETLRMRKPPASKRARSSPR